ncbi:type IV pilin [Methanocorpusculum bavaricum]|uniref:type IV pilin n=1 Tax=Methanocorpusculum bavaricum TaxID=71518 RepID=UPI000693E5E4|nr:type IV pilin [Methanocorpusculum bavaricum]
MKNESGVSSVVGVVLLLLLVVLAASVIGVTLSMATQNAAESTPNVIFTPSASSQMLYHSGGDILYKNRLVFYNNGVDITDLTSIDGDDAWVEWRTGQAVQLPGSNSVSNLTIIALDNLGREQLLYRGSGVPTTPLPTPTTPTPTVTPTTTPTTTPTPTITPTPTVTPTPTPTQDPSGGGEYYILGNNSGDGYISPTDLVDSLNAWSAGLNKTYDYGDGTYGSDIAHLSGNQLNLRGDIVVGREPITISTDLDVLVLNTGYGGLSVVTISRAPIYNGPLLVIENGADVNWEAGTQLILDGMDHGSAPLLEIQEGSSLAVHSITAVNSANPTGNGGGIYNEGELTASSPVNVSGNTALNGAGIYNLGSLTFYSDNIITDNTALEKGGGIYSGGSGYVSIKGPITQNSAKYGAGVYNDGTIAYFSGILSGNTASISGGGVYNAGTYTFSWTSTVTGNQAQYGGGIYNEGSIPLFGGSISGNTATLDGGGFYNTGTINPASTPFTDNTAIRNGGGIYNSGTFTSFGITLQRNIAQTGNGGGAYNTGSILGNNWPSISNNDAPAPLPNGLGNQYYAVWNSVNQLYPVPTPSGTSYYYID